MASLTDVNYDEGNAARAIEQLSAPEPKVEPRQAAPKQNDSHTTLDPRFVGKSIEDIQNMYKNLEQHQGRLANELGQTRKTLDEILLAKRQADLQAHSANTPRVQATDLLTNPEEALDGYVLHKTGTVVQPLVERINQLEQALAGTQFAAKHSDFTTVASDPEFKAWSTRTEFRQTLATNAANGNIQSADALLTEWKDYKANLASVKALDDAETVGFESSRAGAEPTSKPAGKRYRSADLIRLKMDNPDEYDKLGYEITKAYIEKRVD